MARKNLPSCSSKRRKQLHKKWFIQEFDEMEKLFCDPFSPGASLLKSGLWKASLVVNNATHLPHTKQVCSVSTLRYLQKKDTLNLFCPLFYKQAVFLWQCFPTRDYKSWKIQKKNNTFLTFVTASNDRDLWIWTLIGDISPILNWYILSVSEPNTDIGLDLS